MLKSTSAYISVLSRIVIRVINTLTPKKVTFLSIEIWLPDITEYRDMKLIMICVKYITVIRSWKWVLICNRGNFISKQN